MLTGVIAAGSLLEARLLQFPAIVEVPEKGGGRTGMDLRGHIFIVDDDEGSRRSVEALVATLQVEVHSCASAEEFLQTYAQQRPACLVTDLRMPGLSGVQLLEELRSRGFHLSVLVMTAFPDTRSTVRAMRGGAVNLIEKPCNPQELFDAISQGLEDDRHRFHEEQETRRIADKIASLTPAELEVLKLLTSGQPNKVIASQLDVSLRTVESRRAAIFEKLEVNSVAELMKLWLTAQAHH